MMPSQRKITDAQAFQVELADDSGIKPKRTYELMGRQAGGRENLGYTPLDQRNYLRNRRKRDLVHGEAGSILRYFQQKSLKDPSFYYALQLDDSEKIANIFWADARMRTDYSIFGDVITFDTTYSTNKEYRPFGVFAGFNHHKSIVIFGAALLYEETTESFVWLFQQFLEAHKEIMPKTVFTDQDAAMAKALNEVMPGTRHGLCTWHIMQNGIKHHGNLMKGESSFLKDFKKLMYEYTDESKFEESWRVMLSTYPIKNSGWLNGIYKVKEKWANCYMKTAFTIGMRSTQLSESLNSDLKDYLKADLDVVQFFKHFDRVVDEKRYNELQAEYHSREKVPKLRVKASPILKQVSQIYTPSAFELFQEEWEKMFEVSVQPCSQTDASLVYLVTIDSKEEDYIVATNQSCDQLLCGCKKFERVGFLCCHALKVLDIRNIKIIPENYIMKRWTREARCGSWRDLNMGETESAIKLNVAERYRSFLQNYVKLADRAVYDDEEYVLLMKNCEESNKRLDDKIRKRCNDSNAVQDNSDHNESISKKYEKVTGLKKKDGRRGGKRPKSWVETQSKKKKIKTTNTKSTLVPKNVQNKCEEDPKKPINLVKVLEDPLQKQSKESGDLLSHTEEKEEDAKEGELRQNKERKVLRLKDFTDEEFVEQILSEFDPRVMQHVIDRVENVESDGNCGYRCCAEMLGLSPIDGWETVRRRMLEELQDHKELHTTLMGGQQRCDKVMGALNCFKSPCSRSNWMDLPDMGCLFATAFNCVLVVLTPHCYMTYLPLRLGPQQDIKFVQVVLYEGCHFMKFFRKINAPIPKIYPGWHPLCSQDAKIWGNVVSELVGGWEALVGPPLPIEPPSIQITKQDIEEIVSSARKEGIL